jgi:hypothetical protein
MNRNLGTLIISSVQANRLEMTPNLYRGRNHL